MSAQGASFANSLRFGEGLASLVNAVQVALAEYMASSAVGDMETELAVVNMKFPETKPAPAADMASLVDRTVGSADLESAAETPVDFEKVVVDVVGALESQSVA
jgi:hypothetical protein